MGDGPSSPHDRTRVNRRQFTPGLPLTTCRRRASATFATRGSGVQIPSAPPPNTPGQTTSVASPLLPSGPSPASSVSESQRTDHQSVGPPPPILAPAAVEPQADAFRWRCRRQVGVVADLGVEAIRRGGSEVDSNTPARRLADASQQRPEQRDEQDRVGDPLQQGRRPRPQRLRAGVKHHRSRMALPPRDDNIGVVKFISMITQLLIGHIPGTSRPQSPHTTGMTTPRTHRLCRESHPPPHPPRRR